MIVQIIKPVELKLNSSTRSLLAGDELTLSDDKADKLVAAGYAVKVDGAEMWKWFVEEADKAYRSTAHDTTSWNSHLTHRDEARQLFRGGNISATRLELEKALRALRAQTEVKCYSCNGVDFWYSESQVNARICRKCHPPAPGAEKVGGGNG